MSRPSPQARGRGDAGQTKLPRLPIAEGNRGGGGGGGGGGGKFEGTAKGTRGAGIYIRYGGTTPVGGRGQGRSRTAAAAFGSITRKGFCF